MITSTVIDRNIDPFDNAEFAPERVTLPWLQVLHSEDPEKSGFFITLENCGQAEITIPDSWQLFKARFKSGETDRTTGKFIPGTAEGYLFSSAKMLVIRQGELAMFSKRSGNNSETYLGKYDYPTYQSQKNNLVLKTRYLIYLLGDLGELLHQSPIQFTAKGVFGATFSEHLRAFQSELQKAYGKQRGEKFLINGVFAAKTASELRGTPPDTAWVTVVESHQTPTKENWKDLFVGYDESIREKLLGDYEAFSNFDSKNQPAEESNTTSSVTDEIADDHLPLPSEESEVPW